MKSNFFLRFFLLVTCAAIINTVNTSRSPISQAIAQANSQSSRKVIINDFEREILDIEQAPSLYLPYRNPITRYNFEASAIPNSQNAQFINHIVYFPIVNLPENNPPVAMDDNYTMEAASIMIITAPGILTNDTDVEGNPLVPMLVTDVSNGNLSVNMNGSFTYTPDANFSGIDTFTYLVNDGKYNSNIANVTINVPACFSNCFYVDSINGSDANPGTSPSAPWQTLAPVNSHLFIPGDIIKFKRGSSWTGNLIIDDSGIEGNPITYTSYGIGAKPIFRNPGNPGEITRAIRIDASWIVVSGFFLLDTTDAGLRIYTDANHNVIEDLEITNVGIGITVAGHYNLVYNNRIHDLHMVRNTPGGDDDYGAIGVGIFDGRNNEIAYNRIINCKASSYDYGTDGGAIELFGNVDNNYIHHNWAYYNEGFMEVGSSNYTGSAVDIRVSYNLIYNSGRIFGIHISGNYGTYVRNFIADNNTFIDILDYTEPNWSTWYFDASITPDVFTVRNSIFYVGNYQFVADADNRGWDFTHQNNIYYLTNPATELGFSLGSSEIIDNPLFVNLANHDFSLQLNSPAIDIGINLGYRTDLVNQPVPTGDNADIGAFEFQGTP